ncbi:hypothetical protein IVB38_14235 [Bradyrhizobium sp. 38]|uniref:hypothetical protein n=1 Tax=unclassified Bradyrhizobium TaxID=2631580 RepID=UPI001FFAF9F1|nr:MULTISPECIES: hypothetical protein [unclassified Bradyrhizobium]MCK1337155.1 hypothetical protein [Bradyrhizobium sp. 38]MCK1778279.1 hypothetical protein [Bradyrhizobium sp. 132]
MSQIEQSGQRFSHVYLRRDELLQDSPRARRRLAAWISAIPKDAEDLGTFLIAELGIDLALNYGVDWTTTLGRFGAADFLDSITLMYRHFTLKRQSPVGMRNPRLNEMFLQTSRRIFYEERLSYRIDDRGGVHFKVDAEFSANTNSTITAIESPRYANVRAEFEKGMAALSNAVPDGKEAIRGVFGAAECLYRLIFARAAKLTSADATRALGAAAQSLYASDPVAQRTASKMVNAFADWVDACHNYRHEQGTEDPSQPPLDLAIEMVSAGAGSVRWLVKFDKHLSENQTS